MISNEAILEALNFRHACKIFDESKKILDENMDILLQSARLSPSSFGMEHWRLLMIEDKDLREKLRLSCWNQPQITTASCVMVILAKTDDVSNPNYIRKMFERKNLDADAIELYMKKYSQFIEQKISSNSLFEWSARQCYILASQIALSGAMMGIDSCYIEGFVKNEVEEMLEIDTEKEQVALIMTFGYRLNPQPEKKYRLDMNEIVKIR
ncbi:MAG: NAD(P)H-dependent oxidoreductase [Sulfurovum sp.]|nr:MAG: NAD(P)H-dependent oxidoreductase [Sulfurovum sp.]